VTDCLHRLVERQAAATPDAVALLAEDSGPVSYAVLDRRASQLAAVLHSRGIGPESLVAVACERSPEMLVALLGVMKAGGAYVPLDLHAPPTRLADVLDQCGDPLVVTTELGQASVSRSTRIRSRSPGTAACPSSVVTTSGSPH
jgi:non-ribosomal peptide synthetase component F